MLHYLPGENPFIKDLRQRYGIGPGVPTSGAETMYPEFKKIPALQVSGGAMLMVPWGWNPTVLVYNKNKIKTPPTSYEVLLDKQYKGHVGFSDQHEFLWPVAAYLLGYDPFKMNKEQLSRAKDVLIQIKRNAPTIA